jgi:hypothetical protein
MNVLGLSHLHDRRLARLTTNITQFFQTVNNNERAVFVSVLSEMAVPRNQSCNLAQTSKMALIQMNYYRNHETDYRQQN